MTPNWLHNDYVLFYVTFLTFDDYIKLSKVSLTDYRTLKNCREL